MVEILVSEIQDVLKAYEPSCCSVFFSRSKEVPRGVAELKNLIAKMEPEDALSERQFFNFIIILNNKYDSKESIEQERLFLDLKMLIPLNERSAINGLPKGPLFFNDENLAAMLNTKNPELFVNMLKSLESLAQSYHVFVGGTYPRLGEQINALRALASANGDDCSFQSNLILDSAKNEIRQKIGRSGGFIVEHVHIEVDQDRPSVAL